MIPLIGVCAFIAMLAGVAIYLSVRYSKNHSQGFWRLTTATVVLTAIAAALEYCLIVSSPDWFHSNSSKFSWEHWPFGGPLHVLLVTTVIGWSCAAGWGFLNKK